MGVHVGFSLLKGNFSVFCFFIYFLNPVEDFVIFPLNNSSFVSKSGVIE